MNATSYSEFRASMGQVAADEKMQQIRDLLFGEYQRQTEARMALLEARIRELELGLQHRLDTVEQHVRSQIEMLNQHMENLAGKVDADYRGAFDELARGILELGERVRHVR